jgi:hypothetical protein
VCRLDNFLVTFGLDDIYVAVFGVADGKLDGTSLVIGNLSLDRLAGNLGNDICNVVCLEEHLGSLRCYIYVFASHYVTILALNKHINIS